MLGSGNTPVIIFPNPPGTLLLEFPFDFAGGGGGGGAAAAAASASSFDG
jgi:hypothetical protein